jgi:TRAP-type C4-dicarboxylate transport system permease small subunit
MSETETRSTGRRIKKVFEGTCGLLLFAAVTLSMVEIVCRVFFKISVDLFFDFTVWGTVWALLLITGLLLPEGGHVSIDFFKEKFSGRFRWLLEAVLALITLAYGAFVTWGSVLFSETTVSARIGVPSADTHSHVAGRTVRAHRHGHIHHLRRH